MLVRKPIKVRKPIRRKSKGERTKLNDKLDKLVKQFVKDRDNYTCQYCGKHLEGSNCHASHVIPVSAGSKLKFDPLNLKVLCYHHHLNWWHKHPIESAAWFRETFPDRYEYLQENKGIYKFTLEELQNQIDYYKSLL